MQQADLIKNLQMQDAQIKHLKELLARANGEIKYQQNGGVNFQQKYKKSLSVIEDIIKANKMIKDQLDKLRAAKFNDRQSISSIEKEEFRRAYDALLKQKNTLVLEIQSLTLENEKLKYSVSQLENLVSLYKSQKTMQVSPLSQNKQNPKSTIQTNFKEKEAEYHRTISNYEEHHANLARINKKLEERLSQLEQKYQTNQKSWRVKVEGKELQLNEVKTNVRREYEQIINSLRKENSSLKMSTAELMSKVETANHQMPQSAWESDFLQDLITIKANMEPLRLQISQLQQMNSYQKQQSIRERSGLQARVMELESDCERYSQSIKQLQTQLIQAHQDKRNHQDQSRLIRKLEEENQILGGKIIVLESKDIALRNRNGEELEERVLEFETRIGMLLQNKDEIRQIKDVSIHQLLALKAYIYQLDAKIKSLISANDYATKKYKSYKEKYNSIVKESKSYQISINGLKTKILGYDRLVLKMQGQLQKAMKGIQSQIIVKTKTKQDTSTSTLYQKKFALMKEKLQLQQKYSQQELQTVKLNYQTRIMELSLKIEEIKNLKDTIELYKSKNQQLAQSLSLKQNELLETKLTTNSKMISSDLQSTNTTKQAKDIINNLHLKLKENDEVVYKLQAELKSKEETYKKKITLLQREIDQVKDQSSKLRVKFAGEKDKEFESEIRAYKNKIAELQSDLLLAKHSTPTLDPRKIQQLNTKIAKLQLTITESQSALDTQAFARRRLQKQVHDLQVQKQNMTTEASQLNRKLEKNRNKERQSDELREKYQKLVRQSDKISVLQNQLSKREATIKKLNGEIIDLKASNGMLYEKDIQITTLKNQSQSLRKQVEQLHNTINKYTTEIISLKTALDSQKLSYASSIDHQIQEKDAVILRLKKDITLRQEKITQVQEENRKMQDNFRKMKKDISQMENAIQDMSRMRLSLQERESIIEKSRLDCKNFEEMCQNYKNQLQFAKQKCQRLNYDILEKEDIISQLNMQLSSVSLQIQNQFQNRYNGEVASLSNTLNKLQSEINSLKSALRIVQGDKEYHEQNSKKLAAQIMNYRNELSRLEQQNGGYRDKMFFRQQEFSKISFELQTLRKEFQGTYQKDDMIYRLKSEISAVRNQVSQLQEDITAKDMQYQKASNQVMYLRQTNRHLQEQIDSLKSSINRYSFQISNLNNDRSETAVNINDLNNTINRLNYDLKTAKSNISDLEEEIQERQNQLNIINQELAKAKSQIVVLQDEIQGKNIQITRLSNEIVILKSQITRLNEEGTTKNHEINRLKQQIFMNKMESNEKTYAESQKLEQQIYSLRSRVTTLEHSLEDAEAEKRKVQIDLQAARFENSRVRAEIVPEQQIRALREELNKKQRDLISMKYEIDDKTYMIETLQIKSNTQQKLIKSLEEQYSEDRYRLQNELNQWMQKERQSQQSLRNLKFEMQFNPATNNNIANKEQQYKLILSKYQEEIERLNRVIVDYSEEITSFKLKNTSMVNQQQRLEQNLVTLTLAFAQIQSLRERVRAKQSQVQQVRRSFIASVVDGAHSQHSAKFSRHRSAYSEDHLSENQQQRLDTFRQQLKTKMLQITEVHENMQVSKHQISGRSKGQVRQFGRQVESYEVRLGGNETAPAELPATQATIQNNVSDVSQNQSNNASQSQEQFYGQNQVQIETRNQTQVHTQNQVQVHTQNQVQTTQNQIQTTQIQSQSFEQNTFPGLSPGQSFASNRKGSITIKVQPSTPQSSAQIASMSHGFTSRGIIVAPQTPILSAPPGNPISFNYQPQPAYPLPNQMQLQQNQLQQNRVQQQQYVVVQHRQSKNAGIFLQDNQFYQTH